MSAENSNCSKQSPINDSSKIMDSTNNNDEIPSCSKRRNTGETPELTKHQKRPYKVWKEDTDALVPLKTLQRWKLNKKLLAENNTNENMHKPCLNENHGIVVDFEISSDTNSSVDPESCFTGADTSDSEICFSDADSISTDEESGESDSSELSQQTHFISLYSGCNFSVEEAVVMVLDMLIKHKLSKSALKVQLNIFNLL